MDIKRLRYFCTVVECRSITKAARTLHISQPPLSKRLQELEAELGTPLLIRHHHRVEPTPAGFFLYEWAVEILRRIGNIESETLLFAQAQSQMLRIGVSHLFQRYFSPLILHIHRRCPTFNIGVVASDSSHLEDLLSRGMIDIALMQKPQRLSEYDCIPCAATGLIALMHHALWPDGVRRDGIRLYELGRLPLVMLRRSNGTGTFELLLDRLHKSGIVPRVLMQVSQPRMVVDWIEGGLEAAALLPDSEVSGLDLRNSDVVKVMPDPQVFYPTIVKLSTTPFAAGVYEIVKDGYSFKSASWLLCS